eukprot:1836317-Prymnesium_polylepis.1
MPSRKRQISEASWPCLQSWPAPPGSRPALATICTHAPPTTPRPPLPTRRDLPRRDRHLRFAT